MYKCISQVSKEISLTNRHKSKLFLSGLGLDIKTLLTAKKFFPTFMLMMLRNNHLNLNVKKINAVKDSSFALAKELNLAMKPLVKFYTLYMCRSRRVTFHAVEAWQPSGYHLGPPMWRSGFNPCNRVVSFASLCLSSPRCIK